MHLLAFAVFLICVVIINVNAELVAVAQIFRHGHRTPALRYTNDPYQDESYWNGLSEGQLTNFGKRQHYALGQFTRRRYRDFLPLKYNKTLFYAQTTDVDRTHMSAQTNIYGIFPALGSQQWRERVDWQAIPIHPANSTIFGTNFYPLGCTAYLTELAEVMSDEEYEKLDDKYADLYSYLTEYSGDNITSYTETISVWDSLKSEDTAGLKLPKWTRPVYPEPLRTLAGKFYEVYSHTTKLQRFVSGPFLNEIVEYLENMAEDSTSSQKFRIYSGHDTNIASTLNAFGAFSPPYPPAYASSIYIELHKKIDEYIVKVFSKDQKSIEQISVRGCDVNCPLAEFRERLSDIIVDADTREIECSQSSLGEKLSAVGPYTVDEFENKWGGKCS